MNKYWITPGSILQADTDIIGSGIKFNKHIREKQIILFVKRALASKRYGLYKYKYIKGDLVEYIICDEAKFQKFFNILYLASKEFNDYPGKNN